MGISRNGNMTLVTQSGMNLLPSESPCLLLEGTALPSHVKEPSKSRSRWLHEINSSPRGGAVRQLALQRIASAGWGSPLGWYGFNKR